MNEENNFNNGINPNPQPVQPVTPVEPTPVTPVQPAPVEPVAPVQPAAPQPNLGTVQMNAVPEQPVQPQPVAQPAPVQTEAPKKGNNNMLLIIILIIVLIAGAGASYYFLIYKKGNTAGAGNNSSNNNSNSNTNVSTTIGDYNASDVGLRCTLSKSNEKGNATMTVEILYNYKNYAMQTYSKVVNNYNSLTDEEYYKWVDDNYGQSVDCLLDNADGKACHKDHLELSLTEDGLDTVIDRKDKTITTTYKNVYSINQTASESDKADMKNTLEAQGFDCK